MKRLKNNVHDARRLFTASIVWTGSSSAALSSLIGSRFFSPLCHMYVGFVMYMLIGIKICDLYTFIRPSHSRVFKLHCIKDT